jgi:hypothetical protein
MKLRSKGLLPAALAFLVVTSARADSFGRVVYDKKNDQLVLTMIYRGTNPNHDFSLKWGECRPGQSEGPPEVSVEVLDNQFQDRAQQNFKVTKSFTLEGLPCRPAKVTLRTAPRFYYTLTIPG